MTIQTAHYVLKSLMIARIRERGNMLEGIGLPSDEAEVSYNFTRICTEQIIRIFPEEAWT